VSFFDEGDESRRAPRPRRPSRPPRSGADADQQTLLVRRAVAAGAVLVVIIVLVVGVRGCLNSQKQDDLRAYNRDAGALIQESDNQVGKPFFEAMSGGASGAGGNKALDLQTQVNQLRSTADALVKRAQKLDVPGDMTAAQTNLLLTLTLRRDAIAKVADRLPTALGNTGADQAVAQITGEMSVLLGSDVVYSQRVKPLIQQTLSQADVNGQTVVSSRFVPNITWVEEATVAENLGASAGGSTKATGPVAPGSHGHGLDSVAVNGTDLTTDAANRIAAGSSLTFTVTFSNQGENDEKNVPINVEIAGTGQPLKAAATVPNSPAGETQSVDVPFNQSPPAGTPVKIKVTVGDVPGEADSSNNTATYSALFTS
jgi:hypothetical protein